jgi:hypothetical protein
MQKPPVSTGGFSLSWHKCRGLLGGFLERLAGAAMQPFGDFGDALALEVRTFKLLR